MTTIYKIVNALSFRKGDITDNYINKRWLIKGAFVGQRACLIDVDAEEGESVFLTSNVKEIRIFDNMIEIITYDAIYQLKPFVQEF